MCQKLNLRRTILLVTVVDAAQEDFVLVPQLRPHLGVELGVELRPLQQPDVAIAHSHG